MDRPIVQPKHGPEHHIQEDIRKFLAIREWVTMRTHGNSFQRGFPDLYCLHHLHGARWVEVKKLPGGVFTKAQLTVFGQISRTQHGVWVITAATEAEYAKLMRKENWTNYLLDPRMNLRGSDPKALLWDIAGQNPEAILQNKIMNKMREEGWICIPTNGNLYQQGLPDFYALHHKHGAKWVEVKRRESYRFTGAQRKFFPLISGAGHGIWILTAVTEIPLLFGKENWWRFMYGDGI